MATEITPLKVMEFINSFTPDKSHLMSGLFGGRMLDDVIAYINEHKPKDYDELKQMFVELGYDEVIENSTAMTQYMVDWAIEEIRQQNFRIARRMKRHQDKGDNRWRYLPNRLIEFYWLKNQNRYRPWHKTQLRSDGLLKEIITNLKGHQKYPISMALLFRPRNPAKIEPWDDEQWERFMAALNNEGVFVSQGRLGWVMWDPHTKKMTPAWRILTKCFPKVVDLVGYNHSLSAPLVPQGYLADVPVTFRRLKDRNGEDLQTDGSGIYHPKAPQMQAFIAKHGLCAAQIRGVHVVVDEEGELDSNGMFFKGAVFPSDDAVDEDGNPTICIDWRQVKGAHKAAAKSQCKKDSVMTREHFHIGLLQAWNRRGKIGACFELGENIECDEQTIAKFNRLVAGSMYQMTRGGIAQLVQEVAKDDQTIRLMDQLVELARQEDKDGTMNLHTHAIPRVAAAVADKVARKLYRIGDGGGLRLESRVCRLDATLQPGTCVIAGMKAGVTIVGFRFPLILPQGLIKLQTVDPLPHHLVTLDDGTLAETPYTIIMHPDDLTKGMQGDDDGDFMGISSDPTLVELFDHKIDEKKFLIEPEGTPLYGPRTKLVKRPDGTTERVKVELESNSREGMVFARRDKRGAVGLATMIRAQLLAVGDRAGARAVAILIQEFVDSAKRRVQYSDWRLAVSLKNWRKDEQGYYHFDKKLPQSFYPSGEFPIRKLRDWANKRLIEFGCCEIITDPVTGEERAEAVNPLWYRTPGKRVDIWNWHVPEESRFENLVHKCFRHAHKLWHDFAKDEFLVTPENAQDMHEILPMVFRLKGIKARPKEISLKQLQQLRGKFGLNKYNTTVSNLKKPREETEESLQHKVVELRNAQQELEEHLLEGMLSGEITMDDVATLWKAEWQYFEQVVDEDRAVPDYGDDVEPDEEGGYLGEEEPRRKRAFERGNPNNALRVICFPGSPVMKALGLQETTTCQYLYKDNRLERLTNHCAGPPEEPREDPFGELRKLIEGNKSHAKEIKGPDGLPLPFHSCPDCLSITQTHLVRLLRTRKASHEANYMAALYKNISAYLKDEMEPED